MKITNKLIDLCQQHALGQVLTEWGDLSYDKVLSALRQGGGEYEYQDNENILVWHKFEDEYGDDIAEHIESLYTAFAEVASSALDKEYQ